MNATPVEEWRAIPGWEGFYEVSDHGRIRGLDRRIVTSDGRHCLIRGRILPGTVNYHGYLRVTLSRNGDQEEWPIHRLVLLAFRGVLPPGMHSCHTNGNQIDNRLTNLRYDTVSGNRVDSVRHGTHRETRKTHCSRGHEYTPENTYLSHRPNRENPSRRCRQCNKDRCNERYALGLK